MCGALSLSLCLSSKLLIIGSYRMNYLLMRNILKVSFVLRDRVQAKKVDGIDKLYCMNMDRRFSGQTMSGILYLIFKVR